MQFFGVILTALALVPAGAHFFELPNKIDLAQDHYFIVQNTYRGWALFGIVVVAALAINLVLALMLRGRGAPFWLALAALLCIAAALVIFFSLPIRPTWRPTTGPPCRRTGPSCARGGNTRMRRAP